MKGLFQTIILLGAIQGFIVCGLLFYSTRNRFANRLLAAFIFFLALASFNLYASFKDWFGSSWLAFLAQLVPMVIAMPFGPLMYFYVKAFLEPDFKIGRRERWQFLPAVVDLGPSLITIIYIAGVLTNTIKNNPAPWGTFIDDYNVYADIPRWVSLAVYVYLSHTYLATHKTANSPLFGWPQQFVWLMAVFVVWWLLYLVPYVIPRYTDMMLTRFDWYPIYVPMSILIYWLGIKGYVISWQQLVTDKKTEAVLPVATIDTAIVLLKKAMEEEQLYLDSALSLNTVARHTGLPPKTISAVLNQHLGKNFNEYVNGYRVALFKEKLLQEDAGQLTFAGIAYDCGFSSPATFQRVFKQLTGMSPSEFRKKASQIP
ncbi:helix-turn-helix domain-containing protein [Chitinophaga sp. 22321]|uniref:Helix-turn-helix transcriptional regulator n=1 Tax=Chitinophaga hostae TaxID=2831022 RepID=A0ABS5J6X4_9BACT|nr:helix-turn-helix domain-containing protein [Chitinophaga hostae]MBS0030929.1 helix-turn-helix transcriptional regulator [Chitinophaga hostae]